MWIACIKRFAFGKPRFGGKTLERCCFVMVNVVEFDERIKESLLTQSQLRLLSELFTPRVFGCTYFVRVTEYRLCEFPSFSCFCRSVRCNTQRFCGSSSFH